MSRHIWRFFFFTIFSSLNRLLHSNDSPAVFLTFVLLTQLTWTKQVHGGSHFLLQVHSTLEGRFVMCHACMLEQQIVHLWFNTTDCLHMQAGSHDWFWARSTFTWSKLGKLRSRWSAFNVFCTSVAKCWDSLTLDFQIDIDVSGCFFFCCFSEFSNFSQIQWWSTLQVAQNWNLLRNYFSDSCEMILCFFFISDLKHVVSKRNIPPATLEQISKCNLTHQHSLASWKWIWIHEKFRRIQNAGWTLQTWLEISDLSD